MAGAGVFSNSFNLKEPLSAWSDKFDAEEERSLSMYLIPLQNSWKRTSQQVGQRGFDAATTLPPDAFSKRQATSQGQILAEKK
ncbi:hypothetical protein TNCV_5017961 [Trichonephila clavipes]|nr:hypothetical protein TNCV_5017961 [Trichonephila clavipes]